MAGECEGLARIASNDEESARLGYRLLIMYHHTKTKGDIAVSKAIADLIEKGYGVFTPLTEHLPFDLIAYKDGKLYKIQAKYGVARNITTWASKQGNHRKFYKDGDFDYYAVYLPDKNLVVYPALKFGGHLIRTEPLEKSSASYYWYEDFLDFTDEAKKRNFKDFGIDLALSKAFTDNIGNKKVERPSSEELKTLLWSMPTIKIAQKFGVSDKAISKWAKYYNIKKPPRGYWRKVETKTLACPADSGLGTSNLDVEGSTPSQATLRV